MTHISQNLFAKFEASSLNERKFEPRSKSTNLDDPRPQEYRTKNTSEPDDEQTDKVKTRKPKTDFANLLAENAVVPSTETPSLTTASVPLTEPAVIDESVPEIGVLEHPMNTSSITQTTETAPLADESDLAESLKAATSSPISSTVTEEIFDPKATETLEPNTNPEISSALENMETTAALNPESVAPQATLIEKKLEALTREKSPKRTSESISAEPVDLTNQQRMANLAKLNAMLLNQQAGQQQDPNSGGENKTSFENLLGELDTPKAIDASPTNDLNTGIQSLDVSSLETGRTTTASEVRSAVADSVVNQVVDTIVTDAVLTRGLNSREMTLQIHPAELGQLDIYIGADDDAMKAQIVASESVTSELLTREKAHLINALREQGIDLPDVNISHRDPRDQDQQQFDSHRRGQQPKDKGVDSTDRETNHSSSPVVYLRNNSTIDMVA